MSTKLSAERVPCDNNSDHLMNLYFYHAEGFACINHNNSFTEYSLMSQGLF